MNSNQNPRLHEKKKMKSEDSLEDSQIDSNGAVPSGYTADFMNFISQVINTLYFLYLSLY